MKSPESFNQQNNTLLVDELKEDNSWETDKHYAVVPFSQQDRDTMLSLLNMSTATAETLSEDEYYQISGGVPERTIVLGTIKEITKSVVVMEVPGLKAEYAIPLSEFDEAGDIEFKVGDTKEVMYMVKDDLSGYILSRFQAVLEKHWEFLVERRSKDAHITAKLLKKGRQGFRLDLGFGIVGFLPNSQTGWQSPDDFFEAFENKEIIVKPVREDHERKNMVVSIKAMHDNSDFEKRKIETIARLVPGAICKGIVKNIVSFGVFICVDGVVDGLLHLADMSYKRLSHPSEAGIQFGDEMEVLVLKNDNNRLSFGLKQLKTSPWDSIEKKYPVGKTIKGIVSNIMPYGIFLEVEPGVEGLVHLSEIAVNKIVKDISEAISKGDVIEAVVIYANSDSGKLSLSMLDRRNKTPGDQNLEDMFPVGSVKTGTVESIIGHCAIVSLAHGVLAQMHIPENEDQASLLSDMKLGQSIDVFILKIVPIAPDIKDVHSSLKKVIVGLKQNMPEPWNSIHERFKIGDVLKVTITSLTAFGAKVFVDDNIEGVIHVTEITDHPFSKIEDIVKPGDVINAKIQKIDLHNRRIVFVKNESSDYR